MNISIRSIFRSCVLLSVLILVLAGLAWAVPPTCPHGYGLSSDGKRCVKEVPPTCQQGWTLNEGRCEKTLTAQAACPAGWTYHAASNKCWGFEEPVISCPAGYQYWEGNKKCRKVQGTDCPSGYHPASGSSQTCEKINRINPTCPQGSSYNPTSRACEISAPASCPAGYILRSGTCVKTAPTGTYQ